MKFSALVPALAVALLGVVTFAAPQDQPMFRSSVRTVPIYATVVDASGRLVPDLEQADFSILDNGKPAEVSLFSNESQPFTAVVMLDTSASMTANLKLLNRAAEQFLLRLLPVDRAQVGAFNDKIQLSGTFTNNRDELIGALERPVFRQPDAPERRHRRQPRRAARASTAAASCWCSPTARTRPAARGFRTVLERARDEEVMVYSIGLESEYFNGMRVVQDEARRATCGRFPRKPAAATSSC